MTYSFSNTPLYVSEGDYVQFKFKAPSEWDTTLTVTVQIGTLTQFWSIITVPEDFTPDPFPFEKYVDADLDVLYTYADGTRPSESIITVTGLTPTTQAPVSLTSNLAVPPGDDPLDYYAMRIDYNGDGIWDTGWILGTGTEVVENGAKLQIRGRTKNFVNQTTRVTLRIGTSFENWDIVTRSLPVNQVIPFPVFTDLSDQPLNTYIYSEVLPITGLFNPGAINVIVGEYAISSTGNTSTNDDGFEVLDGAVWGNTGTVGNGDYLQLRILSSGNGLTPTTASLTIADSPSGSNWTVTTGNIPSTTPTSFDFPAVTNVATDTLVASAARPVGGITGLGAGVTVPVQLVDTDSSEVKIKINNNSIGVFPATVTNGDTITLYLKTASTILTISDLTIKVGNLTISPWQVQTYSGPDGDPDTITPPPNKTNQIPGTYVTSAPVSIEGINIPVTISSSNAFSLISIDYDTPTAGPRTFDPAINSSFRIVLLSATNLNTTESTVVTIGSGGTGNNPFTWSVTTYAVVPPPAANLGVWYSKKTSKFDGYPIGTVLPILKEGIGDYGDLGGDLGSRYPGFIACEGQSVSAAQYWGLWEVIGNHYGGNGAYNDTTKTYSGNFNLPDYRNRKLCGTGIVDSVRGNSAFVPISSPGKGITDPGAEGGYWYFDKVDPFGPEPLEQIQGTGDRGLNSQFYALGTVRVSGLETLTESITFTITGSVSASIGPLSEVVVTPPSHDHSYFAAVLDSDDGYPMIAWGNVDNGRGMMQTLSGRRTDGTFRVAYAGSIDPSGDNNNQANIRNAWTNDILAENGDGFSGGNTDFESSLSAYYGADWDGMAAFVETYFGTTMTGAPNSGDGYPANFGDNPIATFTLQFYTWWISSLSGLTGTLQGSPGGTYEYAAVLDLRPQNFSVNDYIPVTGTVKTHRHMLTIDPVQNFQTDYTGGNENGSGSKAQGAGLGNAADIITLTFNQSELFMDMTEGTFVFSRSFISPIPDVTMVPQRQAPIINSFHKAKYIIKAY